MTACPWRVVKNAAGFTLLEALIATALLATILAALATITGQWLPNWNRGFVRVQRSEQIALGLERIAADLAAAEFISAGRDLLQPVFDGRALSVTFVRTTLGPGAGAGLEMVRIAAITDERGPVVVRTRAPFEPVRKGTNDRNEPRFADPVVLVRAPYRLSFSYAGVDRVWRDVWQQQLQLPIAIKLTVRDATTRETLAVSTATVVHAGIPAQCISAKSLAECISSLEQAPSSQPGDKAPPQSDTPRDRSAGQMR